MPIPSTRPLSDLTDFERLILDISTGPSPLNPEHDKIWDFSPTPSNLRLESATCGPPARVTYTLTVLPSHCNYTGSLHGGCASTMIDILSSTLLLGLSTPGHFSLGGVSRNLKLTYLRPVPVGSEIRVACEVVHVGRRLALLRGEISREGGVCVVAEHEKANTDPEGGRM